jgi:hypothetical protein
MRIPHMLEQVTPGFDVPNLAKHHHHEERNGDARPQAYEKDQPPAAARFRHAQRRVPALKLKRVDQLTATLLASSSLRVASSRRPWHSPR